MALLSLDKIGFGSTEIFHYIHTRTNVAWTVKMSPRQLITHTDGLTIQPSRLEEEDKFCKTNCRHCSLKSELDLARLVGKLGLGGSLTDFGTGFLKLYISGLNYGLTLTVSILFVDMEGFLSFRKEITCILLGIE